MIILSFIDMIANTLIPVLSIALLICWKVVQIDIGLPVHFIALITAFDQLCLSVFVISIQAYPTLDKSQ